MVAPRDAPYRPPPIFRIELTHEPAVDDDGVEYGRVGRIVVDRHMGGFFCPLTLWDADTYRTHWRAGLRRIVNGAASSCLLTGVGDLRRREWWHWWLLYRRHTMVIFHEGFFRPWTMAFSLSAPFQAVPPYDSSTRAEEWRTSVRSIQEFLAEPDDAPPSFQVPVPWQP